MPTLHRGDDTPPVLLGPRCATELDRRAGDMEIYLVHFSRQDCTQKKLHCHVCAWMETLSGARKKHSACRREPTEEFACYSYTRAKMAFATTTKVHESFCHIVLSLSARLTLRLLSFLSSSVSRPHPSLVGRVHYANDPAGAVSTRRTLRYHFLPPGLFFSPIAHTESWPNSIPLT